jgi:peroxiredoxin Q/BCP
MPLVEPGRKAPAFPLPDQDGRTRRLKDYPGRPLILYFYPKDDTPEVADRYGVWQKKSLYGRPYMGVARLTYLIGPDGTVARRWDNVKVDGHAADVLRAVDEV